MNQKLDLPLKIKNIKEFDHGKRSIIYLGTYKNKGVIIKVKKQNIEAKKVIQNEAFFLKYLNKYNIGPKYQASTNNLVVYNFIDGPFFIDWVKKSKNPLPMIKKILQQCRTLDKLKINKKEFTRPIKHVIIQKNQPVLIDFERCYKTNYPKNVTQFCHFLISKKMEKYIKIKKKKIIPLLKKYKHSQTNKIFKEITSILDRKA